MRQVRVEDLQEEVEGVCFEIAEANIIALFVATTGAIQQGDGLMAFRPSLSASSMSMAGLEKIELIFQTQGSQDFLAVADIWAWLFAKEGNKVKGKAPLGTYYLKGGRVFWEGTVVAVNNLTFTDPTLFSKVISWEDGLSKEKPLLCWVGDSEEAVNSRSMVQGVIGYTDHYITSNRVVWGYAIPLANGELLGFLENHKEIVCP